MDPRDDHTSAIRSRLLSVLRERIPRIEPKSQPDAPPALPPLSLGTGTPQQHTPPATQILEQPLQPSQLPSLELDGSPLPQAQSRSLDSAIGRALTPITELNSAYETSTDLPRVPGPSADESLGTGPHASESEEEEPLAKTVAGLASIIHGSEDGVSIFDRPLVSSPPPTSATSRKPSRDSFGKGTSSRPDSKLSPNTENETKSSEMSGSGAIVVTEIAGVKLPFSPLSSPESPSFSTNSSLSLRSPTPGNQGPSYHSPGSPSSPGKTSKSPTSSPTFSILTSPHSLLEKDLPSIQVLQAARPFSSLPPKSLMRNPSSSVPPVPDKPPASLIPASKPTPSVDPQSVFTDALFYMQQLDEKSEPPRRVPTTISEKSDSTSLSEPNWSTNPPLSGAASPQPSRSGVVSEPSLSGSRIALGRKPSGARALTGNGSSRVLNLDATSTSSPEQHLHKVVDSDTDTMSDRAEVEVAPASEKAQLGDVDVDALAALSFLDTTPVALAPPERERFTASKFPIQLPPSRTQPFPQVEDSTISEVSDNVGQYKSTFAPSKQAVQRKARLQAQQAAHQAAVHRPGRANGKRGSAARVSGWNETSDEDEEDEEEEEEEEADSDEEPSTTGSKRPSQASIQAPSSASAPVGVTPIRPLRPQSRAQSPPEVATATDANPFAQLRHPRGLPPVPRPQTQGGY